MVGYWVNKEEKLMSMDRDAWTEEFLLSGKCFHCLMLTE